MGQQNLVAPVVNQGKDGRRDVGISSMSTVDAAFTPIALDDFGRIATGRTKTAGALPVKHLNGITRKSVSGFVQLPEQHSNTEGFPAFRQRCIRANFYCQAGYAVQCTDV